VPTIIERGELPEAKVHEARCTRCKTLFSFKTAEARASNDPRDGALLVIRCPLPGCNNEVWHDARR
jgi:hypothetical protein